MMKFLQSLLPSSKANGVDEKGDLVENMATMIDSITHGVVMVDASGHVQVANAMFRKQFSWPESEMLIGLTFREMLMKIFVARRLTDDVIKQRLDSLEVGLQSSDALDVTITASTGNIYDIGFHPNAHGGCVVIVEDVTERRRQMTEVERMAKIDYLTGLSNRGSFMDSLASAMEEPRGFTLFSLDLDGFKQVNDKYGHPIGDALLREVALRLQSSVRRDDVVARLGGDEFMIMMMGQLSRDIASRIAEKIIASISSRYYLGAETVDVGVSVGITMSADASSIDDVMRHADIALYKSKEERKQTFRFYDAELGREIDRMRLIEVELRYAIAQGRIDVHYQPILDVVSGGIGCCEALARWSHPVLGDISPGVFIPLAESTGLIVELGRIVLEKACRDAATWPEDVHVAINLSLVQFRRNVVYSQVCEALNKSGLDPHRLEVEITESLAMDDIERTLEVIDSLRSMGVKINLDDFGTGYSSLSYLHRIPFDKVKIDRSFIENINEGSKSLGLIRLMVSFLADFGGTMVVEGVETFEQMCLLKDNGVREIQGHFIFKARPEHEVRSFIDQWRISDLEEKSHIGHRRESEYNKVA